MKISEKSPTHLTREGMKSTDGVSSAHFLRTVLIGRVVPNPKKMTDRTLGFSLLELMQSTLSSRRAESARSERGIEPGE